jgi:hypothetical protein
MLALLLPLLLPPLRLLPLLLLPLLLLPPPLLLQPLSLQLKAAESPSSKARRSCARWLLWWRMPVGDSCRRWCKVNSRVFALSKLQVLHTYTAAAPAGAEWAATARSCAATTV